MPSFCFEVMTGRKKMPCPTAGEDDKPLYLGAMRDLVPGRDATAPAFRLTAHFQPRAGAFIR